MSPTMPMAVSPAPYIPGSDTIAHQYGVSKNRTTPSSKSQRPASTGGGRAWSDDEEAYLLQTRLQKMPYKHIAAHLKKTELACRLHYHQLSHGNNRRKRTESVSSGSSIDGQSPIMQTAVPSRSVSPAGFMPGNVHLPSILSAAGSSHNSPHLQPILPKPSAMLLSPSSSRSCPTPLLEPYARSAAAYSFNNAAPVAATSQPAPRPARIDSQHGPTSVQLRLDCSTVPPPVREHANGSSANTLCGAAPMDVSHPVDMGRLHSIFSAHQPAFWTAVAADYGGGAHPAILERAWKSSNFNFAHGPQIYGEPKHESEHLAGHVPLTPDTSPAEAVSRGSLGEAFTGLPPHYQRQHNSPRHQPHGTTQPDKTRISAILGIDASPRSLHEREMVRKFEEGLIGRSVGVGA